MSFDKDDQLEIDGEYGQTPRYLEVQAQRAKAKAELAARGEFLLKADDVVNGLEVRHQKTDGRYVVVTVGKLEGTLEPHVVYYSRMTGMTWIRPMNDFLGEDPITKKARFVGRKA